ncbi:MAG: M20/M25/M40 family metallo-hydrolase [Candidatus Aminicenantes bacterium]|nr:M20/M25/M40 family metallo-hydrolase [Candidatus Aminicenantes bacterium]
MSIPRRRPALLLSVLALLAVSFGQQGRPDFNELMVGKIREEGFQRSQVMDIVGYMTDVLGARLTLSEDMKRAQAWAKDKMEKIGLRDVVIEPFMDYGVTWDNEYFSLHMLEPDYQYMMGFPLAYTPGTEGKVVCPAVLAEIRTRKDLEEFRGKLRGMAVLASPPLALDPASMPQGVNRRTDEEIKQLEEAVTPSARAPRPPTAANPDAVGAAEKIAFFKAEGATVVLQCESGAFGLVRGFGRPGVNEDRWSREKDLESMPIVAVTPEHYNRMVRILRRGLPVKIEVEVRNRIGEAVEKAANVIGEIQGSDLKDEIVMVGAHFDSWHASPGASDNAAGCAVALEAVRILTAVGAKPRRTIRVSLWGGEEQGLHGSREYVLKNFGDPKDPNIGEKPAYDKFSVYFNQDYGAGAYRGVNLQGNEFVRPVFAEWMKPLQDLGFRSLFIQSVGSTDHVSFDRVNLPGFQFLQDRVGYGGHANMDFFDTLVPEDLMKNSVIMAVFVYNAAMSDARIPRKTTK